MTTHLLYRGTGYNCVEKIAKERKEVIRAELLYHDRRRREGDRRRARDYKRDDDWPALARHFDKAGFRKFGIYFKKEKKS